MNSGVPLPSTPDRGALSVLGDALERCCIELLADYGVTAHLTEQGVPSLSPAPSLLAAVDFGGHELRGTLTLRAGEGVLLQTNRAGTFPANDPTLLYDWTCELANQLVGRLKNKLRPYALSLNVNVPRLLLGQAPTEIENGVYYRFTCDCGTFVGHLDILTKPGFSLRERPRNSNLPEEGDVTLF